MKLKIKKHLCSLMAATVMFSVMCSILPAADVHAKESVGNGVILSTDSVTIAPGAEAEFTAVLAEGFDASRLACVVADPDIVSVTPITYAANAAAFRVSCINGGSTIAAVYHVDNPAVVAYISINPITLAVEIPSKLGTSRSNYCRVTGYEFVPYDFTYANYNDYKSTLNIQYQCISYNDQDYSKWGCFGYFYDEEGNIITKVHLYAGALSKGRVYHSEFNVPVNAVLFKIEGFE